MSTEIVNRLFTAVDNSDIETYVTYFTEDAEYKAGNYPPVYGHAAIKEFGGSMIPIFEKVSHNILNQWTSGDTIVLELELTYKRRADGKVTVLPCLDIIRMEGEKVKSLHAYLDASPAFM